MMPPLYIYVHGFNSSPASFKARCFQQYLDAHGLEIEYKVPALSHWPREAVEQLEQLIAEAGEQEIVLIGSSLGGFYSTWLTEHHERVKTVLVNPAVRPFVLLADWLGDNENLYTHDRYELTREHLNQLRRLDCPQLRDRSRYLLLTQTGDETLDYREAVDKFTGCAQFVQTGGSHGFDHFEALIPAILAFGEGRVDLPPALPLP